MDTPSAMRLGPMIEEISTPLVIRGFPTTSSGVGRSMTGSGGRLTPIWYDSPGIAVDIAPPPSGAATIVSPTSSAGASSGSAFDLAEEAQRVLGEARVDPLLVASPLQPIEHRVSMHAQ